MSIYIDSAGMRVNIYAPFRHNDVVFGDLTSPEARQLCGVVEVAEPQLDILEDPDLYYRTESQEAPYVQFTRKSAEQIAQVIHNRKVQELTALEATITPRRLREAVLGVDDGWLAKVDTAINDLRKTL